MTDLTRLGIAAAIAAMRAGQLDPRDLLAAHHARIAAHDRDLHAFITVDPNPAPALPDGPLRGIPIAIKDVIDVAGLHTSANAPLFADRPIAQTDAPLVARLRAAGAVIIGKANCWQMSVGGPTQASLIPPAINPYSTGLALDPGGSSSGSAVAVAARLAMGAIGGDTGGSVRLPASLCGLVGLRPTSFSLPMTGVLPFAPSLDIVGPIARSVADCAVVHAVLSGQALVPPPSPQTLTIGIPDAMIAHGNPSNAASLAFEAVIAVLASAGVTIRRVATPSAALYNDCYFLIARAEAFACWRHALAARPDAMNPITRRSLAMGALIGAADLLHAHDLRRRFTGELIAALDGIDVLALPTTPDAAGALDAAEVVSRPDIAPYTRPFSLAGLPAITLPSGAADGLPLGLQLVATAGTDMRLLAIAAAIAPLLPPSPELPTKWN